MPPSSRFDATFRLFSDRLDPEAITALLEVAPTEAFTKGQKFGGRHGRVGHRLTGAWLLSSGVSDTIVLADHVREILRRLEPKGDQIRALRDQGYTLDFFCGCFLERSNEQIILPPDVLGRVAALGAALKLDIYSSHAAEVRQQSLDERKNAASMGWSSPRGKYSVLLESVSTYPGCSRISEFKTDVLVRGSVGNLARSVRQ